MSTRIRALLRVALRLAICTLVLGGVSLVTAADSALATEGRTPINVVLLGDSYSAGNGAGYYETGECLRSTQNWASRYIEYLRSEGYDPTFINRACSGAVTDDVINQQEVEYRAFLAYVPGEWTSPSPQLNQGNRTGSLLECRSPI